MLYEHHPESTRAALRSTWFHVRTALSVCAAVCVAAALAVPAAAQETTPPEGAPRAAEAAVENALRVDGDAPLLLRALAIDRPAVGRPMAADGVLAVGRGVFEKGRLNLLTAGGQPVGVLVSGGTFRYTVEDRFSVPVARRNLRRASSLKPQEQDGKLVVEVSVKSAAVWDVALARRLAGGGGEAESSAGAESDGLPAALVEILDHLLFTPPSHELLEDQGLGVRGQGNSYALIHGAGEDLLLAVDPVVERREALAAVDRVSAALSDLYKGQRVYYELTTQPIGRAWWERAAEPSVVVHQELQVVNTQGRELHVVSRSRVVSRRAGMSLWRAGLISDFSDGERFFDVDLKRVEVDGKAADHLHRYDELLVDLGRPLAAGDTAEIVVEYTAPLAIRPNNDSYWSLRGGGWYPLPGYDAVAATFEVEVRSPEPFVPFASGDTVERRQEDGVNILRTRLDKPMQYVAVAAGKYHVFTAENNGLKCNVATYVFGKEKPAKVLQSLFFSAADTFGQFFGVPYPFGEVDVVEINSWGFGQAPPGFIFITQEAYNPIGDTLSRLFSQGINGRIVHEVAHAWWGHVLKSGIGEEQWLSESFADYSAALALQAMMGGKRGDQEFKSTLREWRSRAAEVKGGGSIYLANHLAGEDEADYRDRTNLLYNKGPLVLHALRQELGRRLGSSEKGDKYFQALLRTLLHNFTFQLGSTRDLVGILNQMTGDDWQPWFEKYVYGTETPDVEM